jgi:multidrug efflux pump subunit AcrB
MKQAHPDLSNILALRAPNGTVLRLTDIAKVRDGVRNVRAAGTCDGS